VTAVGAVAAMAGLAVVLVGRRAEFAQALRSAPVELLTVASGLQLVALVARCEAWHGCVRGAGGAVGRGRLYCAAAVGNLTSQLNPQLGAAARISVLRRTAPSEAPRVPALVACEVPILAIEAVLAALTSFTLAGLLGLPWWLPLALIAAAILLARGLGALAGRHGRGVWAGLGALGTLGGGARLIGLVLVAVSSQITRNWLMLHALGVRASLFDAIAVLIAMVTLAQLPLGPSVGAAAVIAILGSHGIALAAAAGVLLTATGTAGAVVFATGAGIERLARHHRAPAGPPRRLAPAAGPPRRLAPAAAQRPLLTADGRAR
jgi:hypothetical protein